jgi:VanZ family protein
VFSRERHLLGEFLAYLADFAWFWPGVALTVVIAVAASRRLGMALGVRRAVACLLVLGLGVILSATITPSREALLYGAMGRGTCDFSRIGPASLQQLVHFGDPSLNVLLYIPLGTAIGLSLRSHFRIVLVLGAVALPFTIEATQLVVTSLDRACQSADVSDNLTGLAIGLALGAIAGRFA